MNSRRMMLGSMVTAAGAGSAALLFQAHDLAAAQTIAAPGNGIDPMLKELKQQLRAALQGLQGGNADSARRAAAVAQVWAARLSARAPDSELRALAQRAVRGQGRAAILEAPANHAEIERQLRDLGVTDAQIAQGGLHTPSSPDAKAAALDRLLADGIKPSVDRAVSLLTVVADRIDARGPRPIAARWGYCDDLCLGPNWFKAEMEIACALAAMTAIFPPMAVFAEPCGFFASMWLILYAACETCQLLFG